MSTAGKLSVDRSRMAASVAVVATVDGVLRDKWPPAAECDDCITSNGSSNRKFSKVVTTVSNSSSGSAVASGGGPPAGDG